MESFRRQGFLFCNHTEIQYPSSTMAQPLDPKDLVSLEELTIDDNPKEVRGKYFRIVGRLIADGVDISELLIERQFAVLYDGGTKVKDWCE